jgi:hypothetical protein
LKVVVLNSASPPPPQPGTTYTFDSDFTMMRHQLFRTLQRQVASKATKISSPTTVLKHGSIQRRLLVSAVGSSVSSSTSDHHTFSPYLAASVLAAAGAAAWMQDEHRNYYYKTDCCGIVGVVASKDHADAREFLLDGLTILKNRGYDSAGIATVGPEGGEMSITKFASDGDKADSIELVGRHSHSLGHTLGIAHTRWYVPKEEYNEHCIALYLIFICFDLFSLDAGLLMEARRTKTRTPTRIPRARLLWHTTEP